MKKYKPTEHDVRWAQNAIDLIADNGTLVLQDAALIYVVNKQLKKMVLQNPEFLMDDLPFKIHERTKVVFEKLGYTVTERTIC